MDKINNIWAVLVDYNYFTEEELKLITNINGLNEDAFNDAIYVRYGFHDIEQLLIEDGYKNALKDYNLTEEGKEVDQDE
jgi:hypothetical protein